MFIDLTNGPEFSVLCQAYGVNDRIPNAVLSMLSAHRLDLLEQNLYEPDRDIENKRKGAVILIDDLLRIHEEITHSQRVGDMRGETAQTIMPY